MWSRVLIFLAALAAMLTNLGSALANDADRVTDLLAIEEALARRDYDAAYRVMLRGEGNEAKAADGLARALMDGLELVAMEEHESALDWYRRDLMLKLPMKERYRAGLAWLRRAAALGSDQAIRDFADGYRDGRAGLPHDEELSTCFSQAISSQERVAACQEMEQGRGYADLQPNLAPPFTSAPTNPSEARQAVTDAFARDDLDQAYRFALPYVARDDLDLNYFISGLLLYADWAPIGGFSADERRRQGLKLLRSVAEHGSPLALGELSNAYREGRIGLPVDTELSDCFRAAESDKSRVVGCRDMERAKGYASEP